MSPLEQALGNVRTIDPHMWYEIGPHLTCSEMDVIHDLLTVLGLTEAAADLYNGHAASDKEDEGDEHVLPMCFGCGEHGKLIEHPTDGRSFCDDCCSQLALPMPEPGTVIDTQFRPIGWGYGPVLPGHRYPRTY